MYENSSSEDKNVDLLISNGWKGKAGDGFSKEFKRDKFTIKCYIEDNHNQTKRKDFLDKAFVGIYVYGNDKHPYFNHNTYKMDYEDQFIPLRKFISNEKEIIDNLVANVEEYIETKTSSLSKRLRKHWTVR